MEEYYLEKVDKRRKLEIVSIKKCNDYTNRYGLTLSDTQINDILQRRKEALIKTERLELRKGIIDKLIKEFCDSPYIDQENYVSTLNELIDIFYEYKNETMDLITDDELIKFMKKSFDGIAGGDLEYLTSTAMHRLKENLLKGTSLDDDNLEEESEKVE